MKGDQEWHIYGTRSKIDKINVVFDREYEARKLQEGRFGGVP